MNQEIKAYDSYCQLSYAEGRLPDSVRLDLNLDDLCEQIDYTSSCVGRQYLYHLLCTDQVSEVASNEHLIKILGQNDEIRTLLSNRLGKLNKSADKNKTHTFFYEIYPNHLAAPTAPEPDFRASSISKKFCFF